MSILSSFVWSVADTLRGPYVEAEFSSVIPPAVGGPAMLFQLHVASKVRDVGDSGRAGTAGIVLNDSPPLNGGAGASNGCY